jgi:hypothetical protein
MRVRLQGSCALPDWKRPAPGCPGRTSLDSALRVSCPAEDRTFYAAHAGRAQQHLCGGARATDVETPLQVNFRKVDTFDLWVRAPPHPWFPQGPLAAVAEAPS